MARVLLVIDEIGALTVTWIMLHRQGHEVTKARTGQEALTAIARQPFDLVVLNASFKDEVSSRIAQSILEAEPTLPIVLNHTPRGQETQFSHANIKTFLYSPVAPQRLDEAVKKHGPPPVESLPPMTRILFTEHDYKPEAKDELVTQLLRVGYDVVCVEDYTSAMQVLQTQSIQLVMTTPRLGSITGFDFLHAVRTLHPTLPLMILLNFQTGTSPFFFSALTALNVKLVVGSFSSTLILDAVRSHLIPLTEA